LKFCLIFPYSQPKHCWTHKAHGVKKSGWTNKEVKANFKAPGQEVLTSTGQPNWSQTTEDTSLKSELVYPSYPRVARCPWYLFALLNTPGLGAPPPAPSPPTASMKLIKGRNCTIFGWPLTPFWRASTQSILPLTPTLWRVPSPALTWRSCQGVGTRRCFGKWLKDLFGAYLAYSVGLGVHIRWNKWLKQKKKKKKNFFFFKFYPKTAGTEIWKAIVKALKKVQGLLIFVLCSGFASEWFRETVWNKSALRLTGVCWVAGFCFVWFSMLVVWWGRGWCGFVYFIFPVGSALSFWASAGHRGLRLAI